MKIRSWTCVAAAGAALALAASPVPAAEPARVVPIAAKRFAFTPKEIVLKQGETVTLRLTTEDVTHGFFVKPLGIDAVVEPGKPTDVVVTPGKPGRYTTICDHFCGSGHGGMKMTIVVE